jgi:hypothetical protein
MRTYVDTCISRRRSLHPDSLIGMDDEHKAQAEDKFKAVQQAYEVCVFMYIDTCMQAASARQLLVLLCVCVYIYMPCIL